MPSVPQSLLWISLVVLWLFVLVPMLISKRDAVRRTSDIALATRVLTSGISARRLKRGAPAAGHRSDPDWEPSDDLDDELEEDEPVRSAVVVAAGAKERSGREEPDYLDVDIVEDSGALPVGAAQTEEPAPAAQNLDDESEEAADDPDEDPSDEYETGDETDVDSGSGAEPEDRQARSSSRSAERRRQYGSNTAAAVSARKFRFRKRVLSGMALTVVATAILALATGRDGWMVCGAAVGVLVLYLAYLRRQTRIEERLRRRRMARARAGVVNTADRSYSVPSRLRRPGAVVLEVDDEDPIFDDLDYVPGPGGYRLPRVG